MLENKLLPRIMNSFPHFYVRSNSSNGILVSIFSSKHDKRIAAIKGRENDWAASFSLSVTSEKHRFFASRHHYPLVAYMSTQFRRENAERVGKSMINDKSTILNSINLVIYGQSYQPRTGPLRLLL